MEGRVSDIKPARLRECASDWILNGATNEPGRQGKKRKKKDVEGVRLRKGKLDLQATLP